MPDASLAAVVRAELRLAPDVSITREALQRLTRLHDYRSSWTRSSIKDLTGLEHAIGLNSVFLTHHKISDLGPLKGLPIWSLYISRNPINDLQSARGLRQLRTLSVSVTSVAVMNNLSRHVDFNPVANVYILTENEIELGTSAPSQI